MRSRRISITDDVLTVVCRLTTHPHNLIRGEGRGPGLEMCSERQCFITLIVLAVLERCMTQKYINETLLSQLSDTQVPSRLTDKRLSKHLV